MKMFKSIGTWMACAAMLSFGLFAQDAPKANPIEVKEQNGEVLGSLGQTVDNLIPSVNIDMGVHTKQYKHGMLWDKNTNADLDVTFNWRPVKNGILSVGINGRAPLEDSKRKYTERKWGYSEEKNESGYNVYGVIGSDKKSISDFKDGYELDEVELRILYTHKFVDVIPYIHEMDISVGWNYSKINDIYSEISDLSLDQLTEWEAEQLGNISWTNYSTAHKETISYRDMTRQEFKLAIALNNILKSDIYNLTPNMSINLETTGHIWMQYGIKFDMPVKAVSKKLKWKNNVDIYWFDKGYFEVHDRQAPVYIVNKDGKKDEARTEKYVQYGKDRAEKNGYEFSDGSWDYKESSSAGFKTLNVQTSLEYAFNSNISISPYVSAIWYFEHFSWDDNDYYLINNDIDVWYGFVLTVTFDK